MSKTNIVVAEYPVKNGKHNLAEVYDDKSNKLPFHWRTIVNEAFNDVEDDEGYNANQRKYVFRDLYAKSKEDSLKE